MRDRPLETGIGCLTRLLGTYVLVVTLILFAGAKKNAEKQVTNIPTTTTAEDTLQQKYIVLSCNDNVFTMDYRTYSAFKNSGEQGTVFVDTTGDERIQTYIKKEDIQELEIFSSYAEAVEYISNLNNQAKHSNSIN